MSLDHIFDESQPIYQQIVQRINAKILRGEYPPGGKLPFVIEAAMISAAASSEASVFQREGCANSKVVI